MKTKTIKFLSLLLIFFAVDSFASESGNTPYFASIRSDLANIRTGPNIRYPIRWVYSKENWPVKVTTVFENWRKIEDIYGEAGWVHERLLSKRRFILTKADNGVQEIYKLPIFTSKVVAIVEDSVLAKLDNCKNSWCKIEIDGVEGWIEESHIWGSKLL